MLIAAGLGSGARAEDPSSAFAVYMKACVEVNHFSGSVLVAKDGKTLFSGGYGLANVEHSVPNTTRTKFRLGSITKQFTAMAILILQERGKLKLDDPVGKYIDAAPKAWEGVTIHHLLTHTGGVPSYTDDPFVPQKDDDAGDGQEHDLPVPRQAAGFPAGREVPLQQLRLLPPGGRHREGERQELRGLPERVDLRPAGDEGYGLRPRGDDYPAACASGYTLKDDGPVNAEYLDMSQPYAAGSLFSTVEDLPCWDRALDEGKLISKASYATMYTPVEEQLRLWMGGGPPKGRKEIHHGGGINGFVTEILRYPEQGVCVVVLCNVLPANPGRIAHDLAAIAFGEPLRAAEPRKVASVDPKVYDAYVGRYELEPKVIATVARERDRLMIRAHRPASVELFPETETAFFIKVVDATVIFVKDGGGKVIALVIHQGGRDVRAKRLDEKAGSPSR